MKILVAVDRGKESQMALRYTCHLLEHFPAIVEVLYVSPDAVELAAEGSYAPFVTRSDIEESIAADTDRVVDRIIESCELCVGARIPCNPRVAAGEPAEEIIRAADEGYFDLIVLGAHGRSSLRGLLLGTVHAKVLHHGRQPVLLVRNYRPIHKILVAYRGSECDQGALKFIGPLFKKTRPEITLMHVQETERGETEEFARECLLEGHDTLKDLGFEPLKKMAQGEFVEEILKDVARERYDLLVLGAYGHKRPRYLRLISDEALNLVRLTTRPVLVYR